MKSEDKIDVDIVELYNKEWMRVRIKAGFPNTNEFVPSFEDWFRMLRALSYCERAKYAGRVKDPLAMIRRFFLRCLDDGVTWEQIRQEFKIPVRE